MTFTTDAEEKTTQFEYDAVGQRVSSRHQLTDLQENRIYDLADRLTRWSNQKGFGSSAPVLSKFDYTYDNVGNRTSTTDPFGTHNYAYDNLYRLLGVDDPLETFTYDAVGNRLSSVEASDLNQIPVAYTYNENNQLVSVAKDESPYADFTYDNNGNVLTKTVGSNVTTYSWDSENRLTKIQTPTQIVEFAYDPFGRRIQKKVGASVKKFVYDREDIVAEYDGANTLQATYIHGPNIDEPLQMKRGGATYFYQRDGLGSIASLSNSAGNKVRTYRYDSFGKVIAETGTLENPYIYTGRERDAETGLYYYRARYYDPQIGRFLSEDPIGFAGVDVNLYRYVANNPINFIDPSGLFEFIRGALDPNNPELSATLECFDSCTGRNTLITSALRPEDPKGSHFEGNACDVGRAANPDLTRGHAGRCFYMCFPAGSYGQEEKNQTQGTHFHFQLPRKRGGQSYFRSGIAPYQPVRKSNSVPLSHLDEELHGTNLLAISKKILKGFFDLIIQDALADDFQSKAILGVRTKKKLSTYLKRYFPKHTILEEDMLAPSLRKALEEQDEHPAPPGWVCGYFRANGHLDCVAALVWGDGSHCAVHDETKKKGRYFVKGNDMLVVVVMSIESRKPRLEIVEATGTCAKEGYYYLLGYEHRRVVQDQWSCEEGTGWEDDTKCVNVQMASDGFGFGLFEAWWNVYFWKDDVLHFVRVSN